MRNIRLIIEYAGTAYAGWQTQLREPTVQETLEKALESLVGHRVRVSGSGRTDAGVHAAGQVANFRTSSDIPLKAFVRGVNSHLPGDISIIRADVVPDDFDSRRSATGKTYLYRIHNSPARTALGRLTSWWVPYPLDCESMGCAAGSLVGVHDFGAFRSAGCDAEHAVREITAARAARTGDGIEIELTGSGFLRNMVRIIVGSLVEVGRGKMRVEDFCALLSHCDRDRAGPTAPPEGLMLMSVQYDVAPLESYP